jgi:hypothetical protein
MPFECSSLCGRAENVPFPAPTRCAILREKPQGGEWRSAFIGHMPNCYQLAERLALRTLVSRYTSRASTLVLGQLADFRLMCHRLIVLVTTLELDMANPKELQEAAEAIRNLRRLPAVQRHRQLEDLLQRAEEWARKEYCKVSEKKDDKNAASATDPDSTPASLRLRGLRI